MQPTIHLAIVVCVRTAWALITTPVSHHLPAWTPRPLPTCHGQWRTVCRVILLEETQNLITSPGQKQEAYVIVSEKPVNLCQLLLSNWSLAFCGFGCCCCLVGLFQLLLSNWSLAFCCCCCCLVGLFQFLLSNCSLAFCCCRCCCCCLVGLFQFLLSNWSLGVFWLIFYFFPALVFEVIASSFLLVFFSFFFFFFALI